MMRAIKMLCLICLLAAAAVLTGPMPARADDGSPPPGIIDDGGTDTNVPVPPGTTDPDGGNSNPLPANPGDPGNGGADPAPTTPDTPTVPTAAVPASPASCTVNPSADVGVTVEAGQAEYRAGAMVNYTLDVFNNTGDGECAATDAVMTFEVPRQLELLRPSDVGPSCAGLAISGGVGSQVITCSFGTLQAGQHVSVTVSARADRPGLATAIAGVSTTVSDSNVGDNQRSAVTIAVTSPNHSAAHQRISQSREAVRTQGLIWDGRTFRSTDEFAGWLSARGGSWDRFAKNHPAAAIGLDDRG